MHASGNERKAQLVGPACSGRWPFVCEMSDRHWVGHPDFDPNEPEVTCIRNIKVPAGLVPPAGIPGIISSKKISETANAGGHSCTAVAGRALNESQQKGTERDREREREEERETTRKCSRPSWRRRDSAKPQPC